MSLFSSVSHTSSATSLVFVCCKCELLRKLKKSVFLICSELVLSQPGVHEDGQSLMAGSVLVHLSSSLCVTEARVRVDDCHIH